MEIKATSQWNWVQQLSSHQTVTRGADEPKLEISDKIPIEEGVVGVVLARYTKSGDVRNDVHYVVELKQDADGH